MLCSNTFISSKKLKFTTPDYIDGGLVLAPLMLYMRERKNICITYITLFDFFRD
jgi:hypothetical protein